MILKEFRVVPTIKVESLFGDNTETRVITDMHVSTIHITLEDCTKEEMNMLYNLTRGRE